MLYVTTRNKNDAHTAHKTLTTERAPDGGLYVPFQMPVMTKEDILALKNKSFGQCVADVLNIYFSARLDGWDVDFCIGRYPVKLVPMNHRIVVAETWHNPDWDYTRMVRNLFSRICGNGENQGVPSNWAWIAIRIATLFGLYGQLLQQGLTTPESNIDIAVPAGDFSAPMAAWYAREMGLPIGNIICGCNDNGGAWDLLHRGQLKIDVSIIPTSTPLCDISIPDNLERLVFGAVGTSEANNFAEALQKGIAYVPDEEVQSAMRKGIFAAVVRQRRMESVIRNVYHTNAYTLDPYASLAYGGLQDYRASARESRNTLLLTEQSPVRSAATVASAMGITVEQLKDRLNLT